MSAVSYINGKFAPPPSNPSETLPTGFTINPSQTPLNGGRVFFGTGIQSIGTNQAVVTNGALIAFMGVTDKSITLAGGNVLIAGEQALYQPISFSNSLESDCALARFDDASLLADSFTIMAKCKEFYLLERGKALIRATQDLQIRAGNNRIDLKKGAVVFLSKGQHDEIDLLNLHDEQKASVILRTDKGSVYLTPGTEAYRAPHHSSDGSINAARRNVQSLSFGGIFVAEISIPYLFRTEMIMKSWLRNQARFDKICLSHIMKTWVCLQSMGRKQSPYVQGTLSNNKNSIGKYADTGAERKGSRDRNTIKS